METKTENTPQPPEPAMPKLAMPETAKSPSASEPESSQTIKASRLNSSRLLRDLRRNIDDRPPVLRFAPTAWAKLQYLCHRGDTEIGGFGLAPAGDLLLVEDFATIPQATTAVSVQFDDAAVADFFETQVELGRKPEQFARCWVHTHPGNCPLPSTIDEETFARVFGACDWAVMFILAKGGKTYARLRFNVGPKGHMLIPVEVDYAAPFAGSDHGLWEQEYGAHVHAFEWVEREPKRERTKRRAGARSTPDEVGICRADTPALREVDNLWDDAWRETFDADDGLLQAAAADLDGRDDFFAEMEAFHDW